MFELFLIFLNDGQVLREERVYMCGMPAYREQMLQSSAFVEPGCPRAIFQDRTILVYRDHVEVPTLYSAEEQCRTHAWDYGGYLLTGLMNGAESQESTELRFECRPYVWPTP